MSSGVLAFAHLGDLHITDARARDFVDFLAIVAQIETGCRGLDFVVLPGNNADNGLPEQYALVATGLKMLSIPVHAIPGDHDMEQGSLAAFHAALGDGALPKALTIRGTRCLFVDVSGPGQGGPDFRLGHQQAAWLERQLADANKESARCVLFMHTYPADLRGEGETLAINGLMAAHNVVLVDMGHTHYNELANDGHTIFAATRSTGQIEEGPVGFSITTVDQDVVSWRFKGLDDPFPFPVITHPADHRLLRGAGLPTGQRVHVRAMVLGARALSTVRCCGDRGEWVAMHPADDGRLWEAELCVPDAELFDITVEAVDETGRPGLHTIRAATTRFTPRRRSADGSDAAAIGAWPENGIVGTQLGPNRNAKPPPPPASRS